MSGMWANQFITVSATNCLLTTPTLLLCRALIELLAFNINVPLYFNFRRHNIQRLVDDQSSVQEHLEKRVLGIYTNAKFSAEATVLQ